MSIVRLIHIKIDATEMEKALQVRKNGMRAAHDPAKGLHFGKASALRGANELISYSEWDTEDDIELYRDSEVSQGDRAARARA
jgi:heme-degrading monooxygenase HmoA